MASAVVRSKLSGAVQRTSGSMQRGRRSTKSRPCCRTNATLNMCGLAHVAWEQVLEPGDLAVDLTCGNGLDTLFLAEAVGPKGTIYAVDIQQGAVDSTRELLEQKLEDSCRPETHLHCMCHSRLIEVLGPGRVGSAKVIALNLGYLPGADKSITTAVSSTEQAVDAALQAVCLGGMVSCMCYMHNHEEYQMVSSKFAALGPQWASTETRLTNKDSPPVLCLAWRLG
ncbi:putative rRNA methylase-domain-containing protein [Dunaliella salina]|uniref:rRNA methylase-domain-containing protein n=1 Tax=Dunaliella salina TaxID=3046 RepID=A0ABQ7G1W2_DUNSA|nr:putative rRNA methylase-domain-containing protein [Dunaliella salina]|eukprot:KAF5828593.1 putative rRNA methylase-domain-containing protein [Dunaliella salina]